MSGHKMSKDTTAVPDTSLYILTDDTYETRTAKTSDDDDIAADNVENISEPRSAHRSLLEVREPATSVPVVDDVENVHEPHSTQGSLSEVHEAETSVPIPIPVTDDVENISEPRSTRGSSLGVHESATSVPIAGDVENIQEPRSTQRSLLKVHESATSIPITDDVYSEHQSNLPTDSDIVKPVEPRESQTTVVSKRSVQFQLAKFKSQDDSDVRTVSVRH